MKRGWNKNGKNEIGHAKGGREPFDLSAILKGENGYGGSCNTYVFGGEIINCQEFLSEWTDDTGEKRGPFPRSILEVKVKKEYNGNCPVEGDTIKVLYPYSLSVVMDDNHIQIKENSDYIFINCWVIDDKYTDLINTCNAEALNDPAIKNADVIIGGVE